MCVCSASSESSVVCSVCSVYCRRINLGRRFQAELPLLRSTALVLYDPHPAQLMWAPWGDLASSAHTQHRVEELLDLCCSSAMPGGGTNTELALHCLHETRGDVLAALELLLMKGADERGWPSHPQRDYHYAGSDHWSPKEQRLFSRALVKHHRDFQLIQWVVRKYTLTLAHRSTHTLKRTLTQRQCQCLSSSACASVCLSA
ncbi:ZN541 protein, partial [Amia calva]|nr:ZN541 protein [Amia calva]